MDPLDFYAMRSGAVTQPDGSPATLRVVPLGVLELPSGQLEASDPFVMLGQGPVLDIGPGSYEAFVTIADVSEQQDGSHEREAYLSIVLRDGVVSEVGTIALDEDSDDPDSYWAVPVDAGTVAFADHEAVGACMPAETGQGASWYESVFETGSEDSWFALMDSPEHYEAGIANIVMPLATRGENVVLSHSGWGDGCYPVVVTLDSEGNILGVHIDLLVVGPVYADDEDDEQSDDGADALADTAAPGDTGESSGSAEDAEGGVAYASPLGEEIEDVPGKETGFLGNLFGRGK
ncbi:MAG: DUF4241 domain-containing protein [Ancrocorticia sp.]